MSNETEKLIREMQDEDCPFCAYYYSGKEGEGCLEENPGDCWNRMERRITRIREAIQDGEIPLGAILHIALRPEDAGETPK